MKKPYFLFFLFASYLSSAQASSLLHLKKSGNTIQLIVNGNPFLILGQSGKHFSEG